MEWMFDAPLWVTGPLLVSMLVGISLGGLLAVRAWVLPRLRVTGEDSHVAGPLVHSVMVFYGLVLALIAVNVFETYAASEHVVSAEAAALGALYRDASCYPEPTRTNLTRTLRDYMDYTIHEAWPVQRKGRVPAAGVEKIDRFQEHLAAFEPATEGQRALHAEGWRAYNRMIEARRARLDRVKTGLPGIMWLVVLLGA